MPFYLSGFLIGRVLGQREGIVDQSSLNRVALVGGLVGPSATGLIVTSVVARRERESVQPVSPAPVEVTVPDVRGMTGNDARTAIESLGLVVGLPENVADQTPEPGGEPVPTGSEVKLFFKNG